MASKYWIKLYHEILDDPKMGRLPDRLWRRCIELFLLAGDINADGVLPDVGDIAWRLHIPEKTLQTDLKELQRLGILTETSETYIVTNFSKRQKPVSNAERTRRFRDRNRISNENVTDAVTNRYTDTDIDTDTKKEKPQTAESTGKPRQRKTPSPPHSKKKIPEAVRVFRENAHRYPPRAWYQRVSSAVGEDETALALWGQVVLGYVGMGWNPSNIQGMLEFFQRGEVPAPKHAADAPPVAVPVEASVASDDFFSA